MPPSSFRHASSVRRRFQKILLGAALVPIPFGVLVACSAGAGVAATDLANPESETGSDTCRAVFIPDAGACQDYVVSVTAACELDSSSFFLESKLCQAVCGRATTCRPYSANGARQVICNDGCPVDGRRYDLLDDRDAPIADTVGGYLARMAFFEAASVDAFACLARDLSTHGAPTSLIRSCRRAQQDEVRHARMAKTIAERHGGIVDRSPPSPASIASRSLESIAIENAVEGCVRETFGVLVGMWQSTHAPTKQLRAFFAALTHDELRHAALSARIDAWLLARLDASARARVESAREAAIAALGESLFEGEPLRGLGLPSCDEARAMFDAWCTFESAAA
jgi:hypothetical protein